MNSELSKYPKVLSCSLENGSTVDANLKEIIICTDQPMDQVRYGYMGENVPITSVEWTDPQTMKLNMALEASKEYRFAVMLFNEQGLPVFETFTLSFKTE